MDRNGTSNNHNMNTPFFSSFSVVEPLHNCFKKKNSHCLGALYIFCKITSIRVSSLRSENHHISYNSVTSVLILEKLSVKMSVSHLENN